MKRIFLYPAVFVLCQFFLIYAAHGQAADSSKTDSSKSMVFAANKSTEPLPPKRGNFGAIVSVNLGVYNGFHDEGIYSSFLQPNLGFEFLAEPAGSLNILLGAHVGFLNVITTGISFGLREPINVHKPDLKLFGDISLLFFDDAEFFGPLKYGALLAFGARAIGSVDVEYRLAGEWRGIGSDSADGYRNRPLWWIGAEIGIAFSLTKESKSLSRKDSLHAALHYISSGTEMDEMDGISSDAKLDQWVDRFWRMRDLTPDTKLNEARIEYEKRVEMANELFSTPGHLGILTEPGRVLAVYGISDVQLQDHSIYDDRVQYLLYVYNGRLRDVTFAVFLFRRTAAGEWRQVYSNVPGEVSGGSLTGLPLQMQRWIGL